MILLCGGTGSLGARIAQQLRSRAIEFRALARPTSDTRSLSALDVEVVVGDLRSIDSLPVAVKGADAVITTANAIGRMLAGDRSVTIADVDDRGNANLIRAAEEAGVQRFVYLSAAGLTPRAVERSPFARAKLDTENRLRASSMREVILRPDMFQEVWLSPAVGFRWADGKLVIYGKGEARAAYAAEDDVAEAAVRLALASDPPRLVEFGGPEKLTRNEAADLFEHATGRPLSRRHVPRSALRVGALAMRRLKPAIASVMGLAYEADLADSPWDHRPLLDLGIQPRPASEYIASVAGASGGET